MTEISEEHKKRLRELALYRANEILESWWYECIGEWADEEDMTDEELDYALETSFNISIKK